MQLRGPIFSRRKRYDGKSPAFDAPYPPFSLKTFKELLGRVLTLVAQYFLGLSGGEDSLSAHPGQESRLSPAQRTSCYILYAFDGLILTGFGAHNITLQEMALEIKCSETKIGQI
jgi:hypothetical protein